MNMTLTFNNWFCRAVNNIAVIIEMKPVFTVFPQTATTAHTQKSVDHCDLLWVNMFSSLRARFLAICDAWTFVLLLLL